MPRFPLFPLIFIFLCGSCAADRGADKVKLIFDTDMGNDVDDALALDMIYKYVEEGSVDLLAVCTSKTELESVEYLDIMMTWYGHQDIPLGRVRDGMDFPIFAPFARAASDLKDENGEPKYARTVKDYDTLPGACALYRKVLSEARNGSVVIACTGYATNLAQLLESGPDSYSKLSGKDLVAKKVRLLSMMGGGFERSEPEFNLKTDLESSRKVLAEWPTELVLSPVEVGDKVMFPGTHILDDFAWAGGRHPMVDGYINYFGPSYDRPCWDLTSVLYAVEGGEKFSITGPGKVSLDDSGVSTFTPAPEGHIYYLTATDGQAQAMKDRFVSLIHRIPESQKTDKQ